ncbi:MAG TPA: shikimate kinase [Oculatellaceae cyanobacterium]
MTSSVVLTGLSGAGKTSVGQALSELLGWPFIDTDLLIEADYGKTVAEIFSQNGESFFRELETKALEKLAGEKTKNLVISTGGGAVISKHNRNVMKSLGKVVFLTAPVKVLAARLSGDASRPLLNANDNRLNNHTENNDHNSQASEHQRSDQVRLAERLENLFRSRRDAYMEADIVIDTSDLASHDIAVKIRKLLLLETKSD